MPLLKKASKKALKQNIESEMDAHPDKKAQDLAIAYNVQKQARKKMASGGKATADDAEDLKDEHMLREPSTDPFHIDEDHEDDIMNAKLAMGGSVADRIMRKRMAAGGQVDLQSNEDEHADLYPELNEEAIKKEYYDLSQLEDQPLDSIGHDLPDEDSHDHIERIRARMRSRRGY